MVILELGDLKSVYRCAVEQQEESEFAQRVDFNDIAQLPINLCVNYGTGNIFLPRPMHHFASELSITPDNFFGTFYLQISKDEKTWNNSGLHVMKTYDTFQGISKRLRRQKRHKFESLDNELAFMQGQDIKYALSVDEGSETIDFAFGHAGTMTQIAEDFTDLGKKLHDVIKTYEHIINCAYKKPNPIRLFVQYKPLFDEEF
ncbi:MAG TPA: hypothetical protein VK158_01750 [Acidobacteriota bacterium]|nr:hypothetical protein [Acidobacteriota bacterium]